VLWWCFISCYVATQQYEYSCEDNVAGGWISVWHSLSQLWCWHWPILIFDDTSHITLKLHMCILTLILPMWRIGWALNNASRWQMGFNLAFKGLICMLHIHLVLLCLYWQFFGGSCQSSISKCAVAMFSLFFTLVIV